jgi:bifunctional enzyme CysN/CysC
VADVTHGATVWLTGLSGAGKTTLARVLVEELEGQGTPAVLLDGDDVRCGLSSDLGFSAAHRAENVRRIGEVALLLARAGLIAAVAAISPYAVDRQGVRERHEGLRLPFFEVYVATPLAVCAGRDPKGLYEQAAAGAVAAFTGISDRYEPPTRPELVLSDPLLSVGTQVQRILELLARRFAIAEY